MDNFLNNVCLKSNGKPVNRRDFKVQYGFSFLAPKCQQRFNLASKKVTFEEEESLIESQTYLFPETEFIWHLGKSSDHSQLLLHPVIHLFIKLKVKYNRFTLMLSSLNNF